MPGRVRGAVAGRPSRVVGRPGRGAYGGARPDETVVGGGHVTRPLVATKLYVPRLRRGLVARPRLVDRLAAATAG